KAFNHVLKITSSPPFYNAYVHLPEDEVPAIIPNNPHFHAFCDAHAAGDGSLEDAFVQEEDMGRYQSRKG
ncbi:hypothetical protein BT96DRAFT_820186, partial [Gymnopus androsaceus JB14]